MSADHAKAFIDRMKTDKEFHDSIMAIENPAERMEAVNTAGYLFNESKLQTDDLDQVTGGAWGPLFCTQYLPS